MSEFNTTRAVDAHSARSLKVSLRTIGWLHSAHDEQLALCRELEDIADSLPANINRQKCIFAAKALGPLVKTIHEYEEKVFFPWLEARKKHDSDLTDIIIRLKFEHCEDECYAEELTDALLRLGSGLPVNVEAVGYMLRGFFEVIRRHIAFERDHLMKGLSAETEIALPAN